MTITELRDALVCFDPAGTLVGLANDHTVVDGVVIMDAGVTRIISVRKRLSVITRSVGGGRAIPGSSPVVVRDDTGTIREVVGITRDCVLVTGDEVSIAA